MSRTITKVLATMQDVAAGVGTTTQSRGVPAANVTVNKMDIPFPVTSVAEISAIDITKYVRARWYYDAYNYIDLVYKAGDATGLTSTGLGTWFVQTNTFVPAVAQMLYTPLNGGVWQVGKNFTSRTQYMIYGGAAWVPLSTTTLPYVSLAAPDVTKVTPVNPFKFYAYANVTDALSAIGTLGDIILTAEYTANTGLGGNYYRIVAGGTGTPDGGSFINKTDGSGYQLQGMFPSGVIDVTQFGADVAGVLTATAAVQAAVNFAYGRAISHIGSTATTPASILVNFPAGKKLYMATGVSFPIPGAPIKGAKVGLTCIGGTCLLYEGTRSSYAFETYPNDIDTEISNLKFVGFGTIIKLSGTGGTEPTRLRVHNCTMDESTNAFTVNTVDIKGVVVTKSSIIVDKLQNAVIASATVWVFDDCYLKATATGVFFRVDGSVYMISSRWQGYNGAAAVLIDLGYPNGNISAVGTGFITCTAVQLRANLAGISAASRVLTFDTCGFAVSTGPALSPVMLMSNGAGESALPATISFTNCSVYPAADGIVSTESGDPIDPSIVIGAAAITFNDYTQQYARTSGVTLVEALLAKWIPPMTKAVDVQAVTAAGAIAIDSALGSLVKATCSGAATCQSITNGYDGQRMTILSFNGNLTMTDAGNLRMAGNMVMTADDSISFIYNATTAVWYETGRAVN